MLVRREMKYDGFQDSTDVKLAQIKRWLRGGISLVVLVILLWAFGWF